MARIYFRNTIDNHFVPDMDSDWEAVKKFRVGEVIAADIKRERNLQFHRKFFALLQLAFQNQDKYKIFEDFLVEIKLKTGHYKEHVTTKGRIIYIPKSLSFSKCDEIEFERRYNNAIDVILENFILGSSREEINSMVQQILDFT